MGSKFRLLAVDDDSLVLDSIGLTLPSNWELFAYPPEGFRPSALPAVDAALVDLHLFGKNEYPYGVEIIQQISQTHPHVEIIAMSGDLDRDLMEECLKAGASRFLAKPLNPKEVQLLLGKIEAWFLLQRARTRYLTDNRGWVGSGSRSQEVRRQIAELCGEAGPILIQGESGSGKEVVARHLNTQEGQRVLVSVNVAAIPEHLFESEFFGHIRGSFTGADQNKMGLAEAAHGGDLFLDEIEALHPNHQAKLLRFLETGEVRRVGAREPVHVQVRIIAASNQILEDMVSTGKFREDLLWRLSGQIIHTPPLRDRLEDIHELADYFLGQDRARRKSLSEDALELLHAYSWPGNVRELKRVCEQLLLIAPLPLIRSEDVRKVLPIRSSTQKGFEIDLSVGLAQLSRDYEGEILRQTLERFQDVDDAARALKISRSSLYKKIRDHDIEWREL